MKFTRKHLVISRLLFIVVLVIFCWERAHKDTDFDVYLAAARLLSVKENIYDLSLTYNTQYFYSPFFAVFLSPFSNLDHVFIKFTWLVITLIFIARIWKLICLYLDLSLLSTKQKILLTVAPHLILIGFIIDNFHMVQVTFFILWATLESIRLIFSKRQILGSILLGIVINIKLLPLPFIPYLIYRKKYKAAALAFIVATTFLFIPGIFFGFDYNNYLLSNWWQVINPLSDRFTIETNILVFNLQAFITGLFLIGPPSEKNLSIDIQTLQVYIWFGRAIIIFGTLWILNTLPFKASLSKLHQLREISYLLLATILLFPNQNKYANVYLIPIFAYIFYFLIINYNNHKKHIQSIKIILVFILLFFSIGFICLTGRSIVGNGLYEWLSYKKSITFGTLLLIPILIMLTPKNIEKIVRN